MPLTQGTVQVIHLNGSHYRMGYQHGRQVAPLRSHVIHAIEARFAQLEQDQPDTAFESLVQETRLTLQQLDPATMDFIRGLAQGLALDFEGLLRYNLVAFLRDALISRRFPAGAVTGSEEGCTTWAAAGPATVDRRPVLAKNRDYRVEHLPLQLVARARPTRGYRYTYVTSAGSPGVFVAGFNEAGLALADTHVPSRDVGPGLPTYALAMHLLEEQATVRSAIDYLQATPRLGRNNLLLVDAGGDMALFELGYHSCATLESEEAAVLVNTNHFNSPIMQPYFTDIAPPVEQGSTFQRYEKVREVLSQFYGQISVPLAQRFMAGHDGPLSSLCRHPSADSDTCTISTMLFLPAQRQMLFCHGQPCQGQYQTFSY